MAQILNMPSTAERYSEALTSSLMPLLQQMAQQKFTDMARRNIQQERIPGLQALFPDSTPEQLQGLASQPESTINQVLKFQQMKPIYETLGQLLSPQQMSDQLGQQEQLPQQEDMGQIVGPYTQLPGKEMPAQQMQANKQVMPSLKNPMITPQLFSAIQQQQQFQQKMQQQQKAQEQRKVEKAYQLNKEEIKEIRTKGKQAFETLHDLNRMEELVKEGKLDTPGFVSFLKESGLDIPALMEPGSQEFEKIVNTFARGAKNVFGSRITNYDLENFLKTIPSLMQSPEGQKRVMANLKYLARADREYYESMKNISKKNKGALPLDFMEDIDDQIGKRLDFLAKRFKEDLAKPVPAGQSKTATALWTVLGKGVGKVLPAAKALGGHAIQSLIGLPL